MMVYENFLRRDGASKHYYLIIDTFISLCLINLKFSQVAELLAAAN